MSNYFHIPELKDIEEAEIIAVADIKPKRAKLTAEKFNIKSWYTDYLELLKRDEIEAVVVATPHPTHAKIAIDVINAGKHVIIQKPMCTNLKDADLMVEASRKNSDLKIMVLPFVYFDTPHFDYVKDLLNKDELGKICMARARVAHGGPEKYQEEVAHMFGENEDCWFFDSERAHGGVLLDLGVYAISQLIYLLGEVKAVSAFIATLDKPAKVEDNASLIMEMTNGALAIAETSWTQVETLEGTSLYGTGGTIFLNYFNIPVLVYKQASLNWTISKLNKEKEPRHTHRHFIRCILNDQKPIGSSEDGKYVVKVLEASYESAKTGKRISIMI